jgi:hypothetical protein
MNWPETVWSDLHAHDSTACRRFADAIIGPLDISSVFSGVASDVFSVVRLREIVTARVYGSGVRGELRFTTATDCGSLQQQVLGSFEPAHRPHHIFGCLLERLPPQIRSDLLEVAPKKAGDKAEYEQRFNQMVQIFRNAGDSTFGDTTSDKCKIHGNDRCAVFPPVQLAREQVMTVHWAGSVCKDFSAMGLRLGMHGPFSILFLTWLFERRARREILVFHECTAQFPVEMLIQLLGDLYEVVFGCEHILWDRSQAMLRRSFVRASC